MTTEEKKKAIDLAYQAAQKVLEKQKNLIKELNVELDRFRSKELFEEISKLQGKYEVYYKIYEALNKELY